EQREVDAEPVPCRAEGIGQAFRQARTADGRRGHARFLSTGEQIERTTRPSAPQPQQMNASVPALASASAARSPPQAPVHIEPSCPLGRHGGFMKILIVVLVLAVAASSFPSRRT